jgi:hypothetical protein
MTDESDRDALLRLTKEKASLEGGLGGFLLGLFVAAVIAFYAWPK